MGVLDFLKGAYQQASARSSDAELDGMHKNPRALCEKLRTCSIMEYSGYIRALQQKVYEMASYEIEDLYEYVVRNKNFRAYAPLTNIMEEMGMGYKDDDGKFHPNF